MKECVKCGIEFKDNEIVQGTELCHACYKEEEEMINNPALRRLKWEQKRNFKLNALLMESVKVLEKHNEDTDLIKRIKTEIIWC